MGAYVIKSWKIQETASAEEPCLVKIECRNEGFISWLLGVLQISPIITFNVTAQEIEFAHGSLAGSHKIVTPLAKVSTLYCGFKKPWQETLVLCVIFASLVSVALGLAFPAGNIVGAILGFNLGLIYYFLNKTLTIGYGDDSGGKYGISFKQSNLGGQSIDEKTVNQACALIQRAIMASRR